MRFMGRSSLAVGLGFAGMLALAATGAASGHPDKIHHGEGHPCHGDGGSESFTNADFQGTYVNSFQGNVGSGVWVVGNGLLTSDGNGNVTGSETVNDSAGNTCPGTVTGTYTVAGDGTGGLNVTFTPNGTGTTGTCLTIAETTAIVIVSPNHISVAQTNTGMAVLGNLSRQRGSWDD